MTGRNRSLWAGALCALLVSTTAAAQTTDDRPLGPPVNIEDAKNLPLD